MFIFYYGLRAPGASQNDGRDVSLLRKLLEFGGPITPDAPLGYLNRLADLPSGKNFFW
jgi:hypothetical protein